MIASAKEVPMPRNRQTFHDPQDELPPVTIEILKGDLMRFTQIDAEGRPNVVTLSPRHGVQRGSFGMPLPQAGDRKAEA